ncbi:hypothetical protein B6D52_03275 [Candidatus Parcubacteria bacterium 4484_255]|nr:MAG: hypothetical protein B6D52_03275 [Candidatus Parcubacteria bacterium 4484_255]
MTDWTLATSQGIQNFWQGFIVLVPKLILALIVFFVGWIIAAGIGRIIEEILKRAQLDKLTQMKKWGESLEKADFDFAPSQFIGSLCKWILIIVVLSISVEILGLNQFSLFLNSVIAWLPNLLVAILIFVAVAIIASFTEKLVKASVRGATVGYSKLAGAVSKWAIWIFGIAAILIQLGIANSLILVLFQGLVALLAIAGGLAFGLGGKDVAADILKDIREKFKA